MLHNWFECKVRYNKVLENGSNKKTTEHYLVGALSFSEAEAKVITEMTYYMTEDFEVSDIKRISYAELFKAPNDDSADRFFRAKLAFITLDEKSGKEKRTSQYVLIQASDLRDSIKRLDEGMKDSVLDYTIVSITETTIMDIFNYTEENTPGADVQKVKDINESVQNFINSCPQNSIETVTIAGKKVVIDRTTNKTIVKPKPEVNEDKDYEG